MYVLDAGYSGKVHKIDLKGLIMRDEKRTGADLWALLRPRIKLLLVMRRDWGDISDIYGIAPSF